MKDTCDLIELYAAGKISLDGLFAELESSCTLDKNQIIEYCTQQILIINSSLRKNRLYYAIAEFFILGAGHFFLSATILNKFARHLNFFSLLWTFLLVYLVWIRTTGRFIYYYNFDLFFDNKVWSVQRLEDLRRHCINLVDAPCSNCVHYHGRSYNGNHLVCGMHPYGEEDCPDFEANYKSDHSVRNL